MRLFKLLLAGLLVCSTAWAYNPKASQIVCDDGQTVQQKLTSIASDSTDWETAYTDRLKWDGGSTGLDATTGRTSLGLGDAAVKNVGTGADNVSAGNHGHSGVYQPVGSYLIAETDPVFSAWNKSSGITITKSQVTDFGGPYLTAESDPTVDTSAEIQAIIGAGVYQAAGSYLTAETDPVYSAWNKSSGISITKSQVSDFGGPYLTTESDPTVNTSAEIQAIIGAGVYVPYTGANGDVALGTYRLASKDLYFTDTTVSVGTTSNGAGGNNTSVGVLSMSTNVAGSNGVAFGYEAMRYVKDTATGWSNYNTALGYSALRGSATLASNTGNYNTAVGALAGQSNMSGSSNSFFGYRAGNTTNTGGNNVFMGYEAGYRNNDGTFNVAIGYQAAEAIVSGSNNTTADYGVYIGADIRANDSDVQNEIVIGYGAYGSGSNTATLGNTNITATTLRGAVTGANFISTIATGTAPYACTSTTVNTNLNADLLDGQSAPTGTIVGTSDTQTLTNKRVTQRVVTTTDDATAVIDVDVTDVYELSAVANATEFSTTGTPTDGQKLIIRFKDAGVAKALTWNAVFVAIGVTAPTTTTAGKWGYVGCQYNSAASKWHVIATGTEA